MAIIYNPSSIPQDTTHRFVTDAEKALWGAGGYDGDPTTIVQDAMHRFATDAEKTAWNASSPGVDDNFVTDAEKVKLSNLSGTNTGDQDLSGKSDVGHNHAGVYEPANANIQAHVSSPHAPSTAQKNSDITKAEIEAVLTGSISSHSHSGSTPPTVATLAGNQATGANVTPVTLTGLVFSYIANSKYRIWAMGRVQPTAATTGCGFQFDLSSAVTAIDVQFFHQLASAGTLSGGHSIADDVSVGVSSGMPATGGYPVTVHGLLVTGANAGAAQLRFRSETTAVTTCLAGFTLVVEKIA